jgi:hypothetical protein
MTNEVAQCGFACFIQKKNFLNYHLALAALAAAFLGIMGCVSYNNTADSIYNAPWVAADITNEQDYLFGLTGYAHRAFDKTVYSTETFKDCSESFCNKCFDSRAPTLGLLIIALFCCFISFYVSMKRTFHDSPSLKYKGIASAMLAFCFGLAAYNSFKPCYAQIDTYLKNHKDTLALATPATTYEVTFGYSSGAKQVFSAFMIGIYIAVFNLLIPVVDASDEKEDE